jgi:hypothetical protein
MAAGVAGLVLSITIGLVVPVHRLPGAGSHRPVVPPRAPDGGGPLYRGIVRRVDPATPLVIAHRGCTERRYQNSMAAFDDAISLHLDFVETDVRHTADGVAVLIHDPSCRPSAYPAPAPRCAR